jgi:hypothetical protein
MDIEEALQAAATAPSGSLAAILAAEVLRLRGQGRCPDGWVEVWAIACVSDDGTWECVETYSETMKTERDRHSELAGCAESGVRQTLIRAYVPPPEPPLEVVGEAMPD